MVTLETLRSYVNSDEADDEYLDQCLTEALGLVNSFVGNALVPVALLDRATLETAVALFQRKGDAGGIRGYNNETGVPIFVAKDPMNSVYPMLRKYVLPF